jgi:hypothetical protein
MLSFSARRLGGANVFMMLMRKNNSTNKYYAGLGGPERAQKLSRAFKRLRPVKFELLRQKAIRFGATYPRADKQKPNVTARFVSKNFDKVEGVPADRFRKIAVLYKKQQRKAARA